MAAKRTRKLLVWALCLHSALIFSQATFQKTFGGPGNEVGTYVVEAADGFVVAGHVTNTAGNQDALLVRFDGTGASLWQRRYGAAGADAFNSVVSAGGSFVAVGETRSFGAGNSDMLIVKVDGAGTITWSRTIGIADQDESARSIVAVSEGGYLISGSSAPAGTNDSKSVFIRLDEQGNTVWSRNYTTPSGNLFLSNFIEGNVIFASGTANSKAAYLRLDLASGNIVSSHIYAGTNSEALFYQQPTHDGNLILADHTRSSASSNVVNMWVQKTSKTGEILWSNVYHRANDNIRGRVEKVNDGGFLLVPHDNFNTVQSEAILAKIDASGNVLWSRNYGGNGADRLLRAVQTQDGGFIAVGDSRSNNAGGHSDILLIKTDALGKVGGSCAPDAGIQKSAFTVTPSTIYPNTAPWVSSSALVTNALPVNLATQNFSPYASPVVSKNIPLCFNQSYTIGGVKYYAPKMVTDTIWNLQGCDTIVNYYLTVAPFNSAMNVIGLCDGQTYTINGVPYAAPATVIDTIASTNGSCDTIATYVLKVWAQPTAAQTITFCAGESVLIGGQLYSQAGTVYATIPSTTGGCDTLVTYTLVERPLPSQAINIAFCPGESVMISGQQYGQSGTVSVVVPSTGIGCDTLVTYTLELRPQPTRTETHAFCPGESVSIAGQTYNQAGTVVANIASTSGGCDTIVTYTLELRPQPARAETLGFCPGESLVIAGQPYSQPGTVVANVASASGGCDTIVTYTLELRPQPARAETLGFCPGESVVIAGQPYSQPGTVVANVASTSGGCDTIVTYTLELRPQPARAETLGFCPGESVVIAGQPYSQPGTVVANVASTSGGCDTIVTYTLELRPQASRAETHEFCPGEIVTISGQNYSQPGTVIANIASNSGGCDTIVTHTLQLMTPAPSNIAIQCPGNIVAMVSPADASSSVIDYTAPISASDCVCPGLEVTLLKGIPSGSQFPVGSTEVCFVAKDNCGQEKSCCFSVTLREEDPCDSKLAGCLKYELLGITEDDAKNRSYRIRVTNDCANKLIYTAIQIPDGMTTIWPPSNTTYTTNEGRNYIVRSPNHSPIYSIRFASTTDSIANGQSDIFEYTLPPQASVRYINIVSRIAAGDFYEAHLNTYGCMVGTTANRGSGDRSAEKLEKSNTLLLFPNPNNGVMYVDLSNWQGQKIQVQISNASGQRVQTLHSTAQDDLLRVELPKNLSAGVYFFEMTNEKGEKEVIRFMLQR